MTPADAAEKRDASKVSSGNLKNNHTGSSSAIQPHHRVAHSSSAASAILPRNGGHTSSRSKRYNRSHAGGDSYIALNEFPVFTQTGDVEIIVRAGPLENRYLLHRHILTRCSGFFEASTSEEWSRVRGPDPATKPKVRQLAAGNEVACVNSNGSVLSQADSTSGAGPLPSSMPVKRRWRYELDLGNGDDDIPMLVQKDPESDDSSQPKHQSIFASPRHGRTLRAPLHPKSQQSTFAQSLANLSLTAHGRSHSRNNTVIVAVPEEEDVIRDYENLFRIFLQLSTSSRRPRLWKQIAKYPVSYLRLGYLARSKVIFQEALVHVVGQWPVGERSLRTSMPDSVLDLIEDKVDDLEFTVSRVERRLFRLTLLNSQGGRVTPASNYLDWLAVSYFRQWLTDNTSPPPPGDPTSFSRRAGSQNGQNAPTTVANKAAFAPLPALGVIGRVYRTLAGRPTAYLPHSDCKDFLKLTPELYSRDNLRRFEKRLDELKAMAREIVAPLMGSSLELDLAAGTAGGKPASDGIRYLTCTMVRERDLPWSPDD
ncbi:hypothetical protein NQ176_g6690 [Zarea fungicola]|uniref:Uncharacterized protein n=1 Tax=Zarea fungicola TaxID=93591 RepID=A0ACC1N2J7_9HYPO|nr:hypothetical protein NQ176_g6690 [Lecanicillium fungicola]